MMHSDSNQFTAINTATLSRGRIDCKKRTYFLILSQGMKCVYASCVKNSSAPVESLQWMARRALSSVERGSYSRLHTMVCAAGCSPGKRYVTAYPARRACCCALATFVENEPSVRHWGAAEGATTVGGCGAGATRGVGAGRSRGAGRCTITGGDARRTGTGVGVGVWR